MRNQTKKRGEGGGPFARLSLSLASAKIYDDRRDLCARLNLEHALAFELTVRRLSALFCHYRSARYGPVRWFLRTSGQRTKQGGVSIRTPSPSLPFRMWNERRAIGKLNILNVTCLWYFDTGATSSQFCTHKTERGSV